MSSQLEEVDLGYTTINRYTKALREDRIDDFFEHGDALQEKLKATKVIKDRRYHLKSYKSCFKGDELVTWFVENKHASSRVEASAIGCSLLMHGVIHHVVDDHNFKDEGMFYRFRKDDDTYMGNQRYFRQTSVEAVRLHGILRAKYPLMIKKREYGLLSYKSSFVGSHLVDWMVDHGKADTRETAVEIGRRLQAFHFIDHVAENHYFSDKFLYFRFYTDRLNSDRGFLEFTRLEQGLAYLGHLDRGQPLRLLPAIPQSATDTAPVEYSLDAMTLSKGFRSAIGDDRVYELDDGSGSGSDSEPERQVRTPSRTGSAGAVGISLKKWYHGDPSRDQTVKLFIKHGQENGRWMVRDYRKRQGWYVISVCFEDEVYHIVVRETASSGLREDRVYRIEEGPEFATVDALISFYQNTTSRELPTQLVMFISNA